MGAKQATKFRFIHGILKSVLHKQNKILIANLNNEISEINYDVLAICTGANYCSPWRAKADTVDTNETRYNEFE